MVERCYVKLYKKQETKSISLVHIPDLESRNIPIR